MSRIRGYCSNCGAPVYYNKADLCWQCHKTRKALKAEEDREQTLENKRASRRNWYYNNKEHAQAKHRDWLEENKDKVKQYNQEHTVERRNYVETRRARRIQADDGSLDGSTWKLMLKLYDYTCVYCMQKFEQLEQDHVIPLSAGGTHSPDNVVPACMPCNRKKGTGVLPVQHPTFIKIVLALNPVGAKNG